jgi:hypothetical protein
LRHAKFTDPAYDTTFIEPPETPAPQFAYKAFKQVIFGTPAIEDANPGKKLEKKTKIDAANAKQIAFPAPKENVTPVSPSKNPETILKTPGTASKGRKTVSFGAQVVDNEGKKGTSRSGIPNDCPGKFPSPWTPGTELKVDAGSSSKPQTKLTAALYDARTTTLPRSGQKPKARDDSDITMDLGAPRSESGKYWKEQYETYAQNSEKEMKKLVGKQHIAKAYAQKKDGEAMEAANRLVEERKRFRNRERELEQQNKDLQERLRQAMAESLSASMEITALKNRLATLEKSSTVPSIAEVQNSKRSFHIFEDDDKDTSHHYLEQEKANVEPHSIILGKPVQYSRASIANKENSPSKARRPRRQTLPESTSPMKSRLDADVSTLSTRPSHIPTKTTPSPSAPSQPSKSPLSIRKPDSSKENLPPQSPAVAPSSPLLPLPSPVSDIWAFETAEDSPPPRMDRLALPISTGLSFGAAAPRSSQPRPTLRHRASKNLALNRKSDMEKKSAVATSVTTVSTSTSTTSAKPTDAPVPNSTLDQPIHQAQHASSKPDTAHTATHHADVSTMSTRERVMLPVDRKEQARRRLEEKKRRKGLA